MARYSTETPITPVPTLGGTGNESIPAQLDLWPLGNIRSRCQLWPRNTLQALSESTHSMFAKNMFSRALIGVLPFRATTTGLKVDWPEESLDLSTKDGGGFYAVQLGDTFHSRYRIIRKLGYGIHSSVWLAYDSRFKAHVSLKILSAHATIAQGYVADEVKYLRHLRDLQSTSTNPGAHHVISLLDDFEVSSSHGSHFCIVTKVLGADLHSYTRAVGGRLPIPILQNVTCQLLMALDFLHRECDIIHTDIKPTNILLEIIDVEGSILNNKAGAPLPPDSSLYPIPPIVSQPLRNSYPPDFRIVLADFGTATTSEGFHSPMIQPIALRAPEVVLQLGWDAKADIWNLGCTVYELMSAFPLFTLPQDDKDVRGLHLGLMALAAGERYNQKFVSPSPLYEDYFTVYEGEFRMYREISSITFEERMKGRFPKASDAFINSFTSFLRQMIRLKPSDRASAAELLSHEWLHTAWEPIE